MPAKVPPIGREAFEGQDAGRYRPEAVTEGQPSGNIQEELAKRSEFYGHSNQRAMDDEIEIVSEGDAAI